MAVHRHLGEDSRSAENSKFAFDHAEIFAFACLGALCADWELEASYEMSAPEGRGFLLKRLLVAYGFMTISFVLIALEMRGNGSASPCSPAWILVSGVRNLFVGIGVGAVSLIALSWLMTLLFSHSEHESQREQTRAQECKRQEWMRVAAEQNERRVAFEAAQEKAKAKERELVQKIEAARLEELQRSRTSKEATDAAAKDFF